MGLISTVSSASFSSGMSFFVTERVTRNVDALELSLVTVVVVLVEDSSTFLSGVRPRLEERRVGVTTVCCACCVTFGTRISSDDDFWAGGRPRPLAGDRDRDLRRAGERDLLRDGDRDGEDERERNGSSFYKTRKLQVRNFDKT